MSIRAAEETVNVRNADGIIVEKPMTDALYSPAFIALTTVAENAKDGRFEL
jgi:hypothetical protein